MIVYRKGTVARQAHVGIPEGLFEEEHGRDGFAGPVSQLYRRHPPTEWTRIEGPLRPRGINTYALDTPDRRDAGGCPLRILYNNDAAVSISRRSAPMPFCFRNADGDELHFIHKGKGLLRSDYGSIRYEEGDYLVIPKGTSYQLLPDQAETFSLILETRGQIGFPERGNIGAYAPFDYGVIETPEPDPIDDDGKEWELRIKRGGQLTSVFYDFFPLDVAGWQGNLSVMKLNIRNIRTLVSEGIHLPPSAHCTFTAPGVAICTFMPRPLETDPKAQRIPWHHRNVDVDEVFFVHSGPFSFSDSASGRSAGILTLNPQGLHHGPRRADLELSKREWRKEARLEGCAVNIDCFAPLEVTPEAEVPQAKFAL